MPLKAYYAMRSMKHSVLLVISLIFLILSVSAADGEICGSPLRYQVLTVNEPTEGFFWIAGDRKYNLYYKGADLILEHRQKKKKELWLISGSSFNPYPGSEMYIDTAYFRNSGETAKKELVVGYSLYSLKPDENGKSRHIMVVDLKDKMILLNISTYENWLQKDENGKFTEFIYQADIKFYHDNLKVETSDDSDIDNANTQLDDGIYVRRGHCYVLRH